MRAKIYSLFSKIGFKNVAGLSTMDYITLAIIEHYLDFKTLEIWQEIRDELEKEGIEPVSNDNECMNSIINCIQQKAASVALTQTSLIQSSADSEVQKEQLFYQEIKESHKQEEKRYQDFINFVERTSNYLSLKNARRIQLQHVQRSRIATRSKLDAEDRTIYHDTLETNLQTTVFCGRNILVKSTLLEDPVAKELERLMLPRDIDSLDSPSPPDVLEIQS